MKMPLAHLLVSVVVFVFGQIFLNDPLFAIGGYGSVVQRDGIAHGVVSAQASCSLRGCAQNRNDASSSRGWAAIAVVFLAATRSASLRSPTRGSRFGGNTTPEGRSPASVRNIRDSHIVVYAGAKLPKDRKLRVAVVGGGPGGSSCAETLAKAGIETFLFERKMQNAKPCGGAIPPCMLEEFDLPASIIDRKVNKMTMVSPTNKEVQIGKTLGKDEFIGMVRREVLDGFLRERAAENGAQLINGLFMSMSLPETEKDSYVITYNDYGGKEGKSRQGVKKTMEVDCVIGADGANSRVAKCIDAGDYEYAMAFQERVRIPEEKMKYYEQRAEMYVGDDVSPDFYAWVFPKCDHVAVGTGTVVDKKGIQKYQQGIRDRASSRIEGGEVIKVEAHPIPEHPRPRRVNSRCTLIGDAAGYVTKCSGEGIYFAAKSGRMCAEAIVEYSENGTRMIDAGDLTTYITKFDNMYGPTYAVLDALQKVFYTSDAGRESFVEMCDSEYVQKVTFDSYLYKTVQGNNVISDIQLAAQTLGSLIKNNVQAPGPMRKLEDETTPEPAETPALAPVL